MNDEDLGDNFFQKKNDILETQTEMKHTVGFPTKVRNHMEYHCVGFDSKGKWDGNRRYKEFAALHEKLEERWPGIPIPSVPHKRMLGNNTE